MTYQVVVGKLANPKTITNSHPYERVTVSSWDRRAVWAWLRLQCGRGIDFHIKGVLRGKKGERKREALMKLFKRRVEKTPIRELRMLQYILNEKNVVKAVASLNHLVIPADEVYDTVSEMLVAERRELVQPEYLMGKIVFMEEAGGLKFGVQIYGGDIITRKAIKVATVVEVEATKALISWMGIGSFRHWVGKPENWERILRIHVRIELEPRLKAAIKRAEATLKPLRASLQAGRKVAVSSEVAKRLVSAMSLRYGLGAPTIEQVLDQFKKEPQTQWGLAMALSHTATHGKIRKAQEGKAGKARQILSTISGAVLLIDDMVKAEEKSLKWLRSHIKEGSPKTVEELLEDVI